MPATTAYQAGFDTSQTQISYGIETVWGVAPAIQFQAIRYTSEDLNGTKRRGRPTEIRNDRQAAAAITMMEEAGGSLGIALSYGTYDAFLSSLFCNDWAVQSPIADATISITGPNTVACSTASLFSAIEVGQFIKLAGFTNPANNNIGQVVAKASNTSMTVVCNAPLVTEGGAAGRIITSGGILKKSRSVVTLYLQQRFSAAMFLRYPGAFVTSGNLSAQLGQFLSGTFNFLAQQELKGTADSSTGAILAAPIGRVHDPVTNGIAFYNAGVVQPKCLSFGLTMTNESASQQYALGSSASQGLTPGVFTASGQAELYFSDFTLYDQFKAETSAIMGFTTRSAAGAYGISIPNGNLMNPKIKVGGPGQPVTVAFDVECNPSDTLGHTIRIDRLP